MTSFPIEIDATQLFFRSFIIPGISLGFHDSRQVQRLELDAGTYLFQVQSGNISDIRFTVTPEGTVDYDPALDRCVSGRGTARLTVAGFEVTLDARELTGASNGGGVLIASATLTNDDWISLKTCRLVPQAGYIVQQGSGQICNLSFAVTLDGTFAYAPEFDVAGGGPLQGAGTANLTFRGHAVRVDATAVSRLLVVYQIWGLPPSEDGKAEVSVLPAQGFFLQLDRGVTNLGFSVGVDGTVTPDLGMTDLLEVVPGAAGEPPTVRVLVHAAFDSPIYGPTTIRGGFLPKWQELAGLLGADGVPVQQRIGIPVEEVREVTLLGRTVAVQRFERGLMADVKGRNAPSIVYGAIMSRYHSLSEVEGFMGAPLADEEPAPRGGRRSVFEGGVIHWHPETGAWETHGAVHDLWMALGGPAGIMGYPITDEQVVLRGGAGVGAVSRFEALPRDGLEPTVGAIYWSRATAAHEMYGPILTAWQTQFGGPNGALGFPTGAPSHTPDNVGRFQTFDKGLVVWRPETGAVPVAGGIILNLFSFSVDDDFNVQIDVTSRFGNTPGPVNHGRIPADGQFSPGTETFPPREILTFPNVTPDLVVSVNHMQAISERLIGRDARMGNVAPITYDINNIWGLREANHSHHDGSFTAVLEMQHLAEPPLGGKPFRQERFWPFSNFDTEPLSWAQYEQTFRDIAEIDKHVSVIPPRFHPLEIAVYETVYRSLANGGNCFGMVVEAMYALERRSLFEEPIFSSGSYRKDGMQLVSKGEAPASENAEVANAINIKMGYQIGSDLIGWLLGKWTAGALHDPVRAFRESRDAFARGDWPLLTISDKDKFSQDGHAVMPYFWDPATEEQIAAQPLSGQTWHIFVANPNASAAGGAPLPDNNDQCMITIDPFRQTWKMVVRTDEGPWTGSNDEGGRLLTIPYSALSSRPNSPADMVAALLDAIAVGALIVVGGNATSQITDPAGRTLYSRAPEGRLRLNRDPATRIPGLALLPVYERSERAREVYVWRPDAGDAEGGLQHVLDGSGDFTWSLLSPSLSASITASGVAGDTLDGPVPGDSFSIENLGGAEQAVTHAVAPNRGSRTIGMSVAGWPGSDRSKAKWFEVSGLVAAPGHTVRAQVLNAGKSLSIHNDGPAATFDLAVHGGLDSGPVAVRQRVEMPSGKAWRFEAADWSGRSPDAPIDILEADRIGGAVLRQFRI